MITQPPKHWNNRTLKLARAEPVLSLSKESPRILLICNPKRFLAPKLKSRSVTAIPPWVKNSRFPAAGMKQYNNGSILISLLITAAVFSIVIYSLLGVIATQFDFSFRQIAGDQALNIAEAGINYYRWHLAKAPNDLQDGSGGPGPYLHDYHDPQGSLIGRFSLEITPPSQGEPAIIKSTGWTITYPTIKRSITVRLGQTSYANFAFLNNKSVWFGQGVTVNGKVHSNVGVRQDGINTSEISCASTTYICGKETGCDPPEEKPGIWGEGQDQSLWKFPVPVIDFNSIAFDFGKMRSDAQNHGLYLPPSGTYGYNLVFNSDGTATIYKVTAADGYEGWTIEDGCKNRREIIKSQTLISTYNLADAPIFFIEDNIWVQGVVNGRTTVVAARFPLETYQTNVWLPDNLTYLAKDGNHKLGLIAEKDVIFTRDVPEYFDLNAAILAQNGRTIRHHYNQQGCRVGGQGTDSQKNEFNFYGSLISNQRSYWNFSSSPGSPASGFVKTTLDYDPTNYGDPPPYFPSYGTYQFLSWKEVRPD